MAFSSPYDKGAQAGGSRDSEVLRDTNERNDIDIDIDDDDDDDEPGITCTTI